MSVTTTSVVGIDLGTTNSLAAFVTNGRPQIVRDISGNGLIPSCLCFEKDGRVTIGSEAKRRALSDPDHTIFSVKRLMGRTLAELAADLPTIPHQIFEVTAANGTKSLRVKIGEHDYSPEELSAMILKEVRARAGNPTRAVITVPAYFDDTQRQATRDAAKIAGLDVLRIINEPTAAALAYGLDQKTTGTVAVYDLGGGTFDCSILQLQDGVFKVLATNGDTRLGGDDFDRRLMTLIAEKIDFKPATAVELQTLRDTAERVKIELSTVENVAVTILNRSTTVTRKEFETAIQPLVDQSLNRCKAALRDAGLTVRDVNHVVLVGGSTRVPLVRHAVEKLFGQVPLTNVNPDEVVALGAAIQADVLAGNRKDVLLLDVVPLSLGIETLGGVVDKIIHRNSIVPCRATMRYSTSVDHQTAILINVFQGERELAKDCRPLGQFKLAGIPPMPAQFPQVDITFTVDANGMLTVSAVEKRSGQSMSVSVQQAFGLSQDDVEKLVLESVDHARDDFAARQWIEFRNKATGDLRHSEKAMAQVGERLTAEQKSKIESARSALQAALNSNDHRQLQAATVAFGDATNPLAELLMNSVVQSALSGKAESEI